MKISTKISLLVLTLVVVIVVLSNAVINQQVRTHVRASQLEWAGTLSSAIGESLSRLVIDGDVVRVRQTISRITRQDKAIEYIYVTDFDGRLFAHSFDNGFPRFLADKIGSHDTVGDKGGVLFTYKTRKGEIVEFHHELVRGLKAHLYIGLNQREVDEVLGQARKDITLTLVLVGLLGLLFALWEGRLISRPFSVFANRIRRYGEEAELESAPISSSPEVVQLETVFRDMVASREEAQQTLRERERNLSLTLNSIGDAVIATDRNGLVTRMNPVAEQLTGWREGSAVGERLVDVFHIINAHTRATASNPVDRVLESGDIVGLANHTVLVARDGEEYQIADSAAPIRDDDGEVIGVILVFRDVTEEYALHEALVESQQRLLLHREQSPMGVIEWDTDFRVVDWNRSAEKIFGFTRAEVLGRRADEFILPEEAKPYVNGIWSALLEQVGGQHSVNENLNKHGDRITCEWFNTSLIDKDGNVVGVASQVVDVTRQQETEEALRRSQKMEAVGQLSGGIAHDFNNQLGVVIGYLDMMDASPDLPARYSNWISTASKAALRCMDLTRQLLAFSRQRVREVQIVNLNETLSEIDAMIARTVTPEIQVDYRLDQDIWPVNVDQGDMQDAILNLVLNARDAMKSGGSIVIETGNRHVDKAMAELSPGAMEGQHVMLSVSDTGQGMPEEMVEKIFEPFFTTKPVGKGTGLGLSMVYGIVKRNKGFIQVETEQGRGTEFRIYLPRADIGEGDVAQESEVESILPSGSETILVVDDERDLLGLAVEYLRDLGYRTLEANNATEALEILGGSEKVDLMFSDVVMPGGMNGVELAEQASAIRPDMKILLTSGYTSKGILKRRVKNVIRPILEKPYRKNSLALRVREALDY